jgi:hypothetical protein
MVQAYEMMQAFWSPQFPPLVPGGLYDLTRWIDRVLALFGEPFSGIREEWQVGARAGLLIFGLASGGIAWLARRDAWRGALLLIPIVATIGAAALELYPAWGRLLLFLLPVVSIAAAAGVEGLARVAGRSTAAWAAGVLLLLPVLAVGQSVREPGLREEVRPALDALNAEIQPNDSVYVFRGAVEAVDYYRRLGRLSPQLEAALVNGGFHRYKIFGLIAEVCAVPNRERVWFLMAHPWTPGEQEFIFTVLQQASVSVRDIAFPGASLRLYDLSGQAAQAACALAVAR